LASFLSFSPVLLRKKEKMPKEGVYKLRREEIK
jgi:hypothetical protein